jgi:hypothetical protein
MYGPMCSAPDGTLKLINAVCTVTHYSFKIYSPAIPPSIAGSVTLLSLDFPGCCHPSNCAAFPIHLTELQFITANMPLFGKGEKQNYASVCYVTTLGVEVWFYSFLISGLEGGR